LPSTDDRSEDARSPLRETDNVASGVDARGSTPQSWLTEVNHLPVGPYERVESIKTPFGAAFRATAYFLGSFANAGGYTVRVHCMCECVRPTKRPEVKHLAVLPEEWMPLVLTEGAKFIRRAHSYRQSLAMPYDVAALAYCEGCAVPSAQGAKQSRSRELMP
jgi:hypothetical protein